MRDQAPLNATHALKTPTETGKALVNASMAGAHQTVQSGTENAIRNVTMTATVQPPQTASIVLKMPSGILMVPVTELVYALTGGQEMTVASSAESVLQLVTDVSAHTPTSARTASEMPTMTVKALVSAKTAGWEMTAHSSRSHVTIPVSCVSIPILMSASRAHQASRLSMDTVLNVLTAVRPVRQLMELLLTSAPPVIQDTAWLPTEPASHATQAVAPAYMLVIPPPANLAKRIQLLQLPMQLIPKVSVSATSRRFVLSPATPARMNAQPARFWTRQLSCVSKIQLAAPLMSTKLTSTLNLKANSPFSMQFPLTERLLATYTLTPVAHHMLWALTEVATSTAMVQMSSSTTSASQKRILKSTG